MSGLVAVVGPTGAGKSALAMRIADELHATILSVDSMQVYRGMDIGTAKPSATERSRVPHRMIDVADPEHDYSVAAFQRDARAAIEEGPGRVLIVGGSGLHLRAIIDPLEFPPSDPAVRSAVEAESHEALLDELLRHDPGAGSVIDVHNPRRVVRAVEILRLTALTPTVRFAQPSAREVREYRSLMPVQIIGVDRSDEDPYTSRLSARVDAMREAGLLAEVSNLRDRLGRQAAQAVGYKELIEVVDGEITPDVGFARVKASTRSLVKRQRTFFRRDPRIRWFDLDSEEIAASSAVVDAMNLAVPR